MSLHLPAVNAALNGVAAVLLVAGLAADHHGVAPGDGLPDLTFMVFQGMFFIITPALIVGAFAERMKFAASMIFAPLWLIIVYCPIAHWVWGGGWMAQIGALDFAGGTVVHINAGVAALALVMVLGKRAGFRENLLRRTPLFWTASIGDHTVRTELVAANHDPHERLVR